jgi:hypothetical protein
MATTTKHDEKINALKLQRGAEQQKLQQNAKRTTVEKFLPVHAFCQKSSKTPNAQPG